MYIWLGFVGGLLAAGAIYLILIRFGTFYLRHSGGFIACSAGDVEVHQASEQQLQEAVDLLIPGDLYDILWVSRQNDEYSGLTITVEEGKPTLSTSFKTAEEDVEIEAFRKQMADAGYRGTEESNGFNGGIGEKYRTTTFEFELPQSAEDIVRITKVALGALQPLSTEDYFFVQGSKFVPRGKGVAFRANKDPLANLF